MKALFLTSGLCLTMTTIATIAEAQSFDCRKATTANERTICNSATLRALDEQMSEEFSSARRFQSSARAERRLVRKQRAWIEARNSCRFNRACTIDLYEARIERLAAASEKKSNLTRLDGFTRVAWNGPHRSRKPRPLNRCNIQGYSIDKDRRGLNVRSGPGKGYRVVARLRRVHDGGGDYILPEMNIVESRGSWLRITRARVGIGGRSLFDGSGWVHASRVAASTRGSYPKRVQLHRARSIASRSLAALPVDTEVGIRGCVGQWAQVSYRGKRGWLAPGKHCGSAETSCN